jgi:hypothetical protein
MKSAENFEESGMTDTRSAATNILCREITDSDIEAVADLLTRGFVGRSRDYWMRGLRRQSERDVPAGYPRYGYLLDNNGVAVGVLLVVFTSVWDNGETTIRCNVSSWYVDPPFRGHAPRLSWMALKQKHVTYIDITPAVPTWPIVEAMGFKRYCSGLLFSIPALSRYEPDATVETISPSTKAVPGLSLADLDLLKTHAQYGCLSLVCHTEDGPFPFVLMHLKARSGRIPLPAMQLIYCRDIDSYVRCAGAIGRMLFWKGKPVVTLDANGTVPGLVGIYTEARGRKYFKGPNPPRLADLAETELVLFGP